MIIVFDLDETLYDERTYIESGFRAVAKHLNKKYDIDRNELFVKMLKELKKSRTGVFNRVLSSYQILSNKNVHECLMVYRKQKPKISLYSDALRFLKKYKDTTKYVITDGNVLVQKNKIYALKIGKYMKHCYITWRKGKIYAKPSPYFINLIARNEKIKPEELVFIGDNPEKDFVGIKKIGYKTIRVLRGEYKNIKKSLDYEADLEVTSFDQLEKL